VSFLKKSALFIFVFIALVIFFSPKTQLYYKAEEILADKHIILSEETVNDNGFVFSIEGGRLYYDDLEVAQLNEVTFLPLIFFNRISVAPFTFSREVRNFIQGMVTQMYLQYSLIDPLHIIYKAEGDFGTITGSVAFLDRNISIDLTPSDKLLQSKQPWLRKLKKEEGGVYHYESTY
jgi:hypothetical protein